MKDYLNQYCFIDRQGIPEYHYDFPAIIHHITIKSNINNDPYLSPNY